MAAAYLLTVGLPMVGVAAGADETPLDKDDFTLFNPTPDTQLRGFSSDRPSRANSPYTLDAGHFQYETDLVVWGSGSFDGVRIHQWTVLDPSFKLGLTNNVDAELQLTFLLICDGAQLHTG